MLKLVYPSRTRAVLPVRKTNNAPLRACASGCIYQVGCLDSWIGGTCPGSLTCVREIAVVAAGYPRMGRRAARDGLAFRSHGPNAADRRRHDRAQALRQRSRSRRRLRRQETPPARRRRARSARTRTALRRARTLPTPPAPAAMNRRHAPPTGGCCPMPRIESRPSSKASVLPPERRSRRNLPTSSTRSPRPVRKRVRPAPNEPVPSTANARRPRHARRRASTRARSRRCSPRQSPRTPRRRC